MGYVKDERPSTMMVNGFWNVGSYSYKAPRHLDEFVAGLKERKLIGSHCLGCGKVIVPLRNVCGRCHRKMDGRMVVSNRGTVTCFIVSPPLRKGKFTVLGMDPVDAGIIEDGEVIVPVFVRLDGSDSNINTVLMNCDPKEVFIGMRVQIVWAETPEGKLSDLEGVEPVGDGQ